MKHDREPVGQAVNSIIQALDIIACMALVNDTYDEVAAEKETLKWVIRRTNLILRLIKSRQDEPINAKIRLVQ
jgi:hypothetical protein